MNRLIQTSNMILCYKKNFAECIYNKSAVNNEYYNLKDAAINIIRGTFIDLGFINKPIIYDNIMCTRHLDFM